MAAGSYGLSTLNANWYEDRCQPMGALNATGGYDKRKPRIHETDIAYIGERFDVLSRIARMPVKESYATCDDGFRERMSTNRVDFAHPKSRTEFVTKPPERPTMITAESVPEVNFEGRRPLPGPRSGFGCALSKHEEHHEQGSWNTTTEDFYGSGGARKNNMRTFVSEEMRPCGVASEADEARISGVKVGKLCGETFNESSDPGVNTATQRAWLYQSDPALMNAHLGGQRPRPTKVDNDLSLPIGEGAMAKVRADLKERKGRLFRTATHITKGAGKRSGINIFMDG